MFVGKEYVAFRKEVLLFFFQIKAVAQKHCIYFRRWSGETAEYTGLVFSGIEFLGCDGWILIHMGFPINKSKPQDPDTCTIQIKMLCIQNMFPPIGWQVCMFQGSGLWPTHDWDGKKFTKTHYPKWHSLAGTQLCGGWRGVLDGIQGDQDFLHKVFNFKRPLLQHVFSWVSTCQLCTGLAPPQHLNLKMVTVSPSFWGAVRMVRVFPQVVLWSYASRF